MSQRRHAHGHALALLGLGRTRGGEADADHLVDGGKEPKLGLALEVPASQIEERGREVEERPKTMSHKNITVVIGTVAMATVRLFVVGFIESDQVLPFL